MKTAEETKQFMVRLPLSVLKQLDVYVLKQRKLTGMNVTRTDAVRGLLTQGLRRTK